MEKKRLAGWLLGMFVFAFANIADAMFIDIGNNLAYDTSNKIVWLTDRAVFEHSSSFYESIYIMHSAMNSDTFREVATINGDTFALSWRTASFSEMGSLDFGKISTREIFTPDSEKFVGAFIGYYWNKYYITGAFGDLIVAGENKDIPFYSMEAYVDVLDPDHTLLNWDEMDFGIQDPTLSSTGRLFAVADLRPVPEPGTIASFGLALPLLMYLKRRQSSRKAWLHAPPYVCAASKSDHYDTRTGMPNTFQYW